MSLIPVGNCCIKYLIIKTLYYVAITHANACKAFYGGLNLPLAPKRLN